MLDHLAHNRCWQCGVDVEGNHTASARVFFPDISTTKISIGRKIGLISIGKQISLISIGKQISLISIGKQISLISIGKLISLISIGKKRD
jgi:hypothetical protein